MKFSNYYRSAFFSPARTFERLSLDSRMVKLSFSAVMIQAILYTLVYVFLVFGGGRPFHPWLDIPEEVYYRYNVFFCAPSMLLGWILSAGVVQVLSRMFYGKGTFEQTLCIIGFGISIASWSTGIHDLLTSFLGAVQVIDQRNYELAMNSPTIWRTLLWVLMSAYLIWFIVLFTKGIKVVHKIGTGYAFITGLAGFVTYQLFFFIFNR